MRNAGLTIMFFCMIFGCSRQINRRLIKRLTKCEKSWQYFKLDHQLKGKVLTSTRSYCGFFALSSATIIVSSKGDTIRVLELDCSNRIFIPGDAVLVNPVIKADSVGAASDFKFTCLVKKTCYGTVTKIQ